jgi:hypothetical protein
VIRGRTRATIADLACTHAESARLRRALELLGRRERANDERVFATDPVIATCD